MSDSTAQPFAAPATPPQPEPWLRGIAEDIHPVTGHLLRAAEQIREDVEAAIGDLTPELLWATPFGMTSAGFHARHLAGSTERLCTYLEGKQLSPEQIAAMKEEGGTTGNTEEAGDLLASINLALDRYEALVLGLDEQDLAGVREIGRKRYQTTAAGIAIHIAEHGQRHVGGLIAAAKLARATAAR